MIGAQLAKYSGTVTGSNTDIIANEFVQACGLSTFLLEGNQNLQMACMGSCTRLQYGTYLEISSPKIKERCYFDVVNVEGFDMILGTPFLHGNGITLHFNGQKAYARIHGSPPLMDKNPSTASARVAVASAARSPQARGN